MTERYQTPPAEPVYSDPVTEPPPTQSDPAAEVSGDTLPSTGLLSFYDHLRDRVVEAVERRGGKFGSNTAQALLLVPDVFMLLVRVSLDKNVPKEDRALVAGALAYFILPVDFLPEAVLGPVGYTDDLVLGLAMLSKAFGKELEPYTDKYWSGSRSVRSVMRDVLGTAQKLVGFDVYKKLRGVLKKRGVNLDDEVNSAKSL